MVKKEIIKPNLLKIATVIGVLVLLYFFFLLNIKVRYVCTVPGEVCKRETQQAQQTLAMQSTLGIGVPLAIIAYLLIGYLQSRKK